MHVNSETGFQNFTSSPAHCKTDFTGPTGNQLSTDQRTNFDPFQIESCTNNSVLYSHACLIKKIQHASFIIFACMKIIFGTMSFIKGRHLEFLAHNYDRATKLCALVGRFTSMGSVKSDDDVHPVLVRQFYATKTLLDSFWELGDEIPYPLITSTQDCCGGNSAQRPCSHIFVLL